MFDAIVVFLFYISGAFISLAMAKEYNKHNKKYPIPFSVAMPSSLFSWITVMCFAFDKLTRKLNLCEGFEKFVKSFEKGE